MKTAYLGCLVLVGLGCGGSVDGGIPAVSDAGVDAASDFDSNDLADSAQPDVAPVPFAPAKHPAAPQVESYGGKTLAAPNVVPVFFSGDSTMQASIETFLAGLATSSYWTATTSEYGVGAMTVGKTIVSTDTPPATGDAIDAWLANMTDGTHPEWPAPDTNTVYAVFLPQGASITIPQWGKSCTGFGGYHSEATGKKNESIVYAVMPRCNNFGSLKGVDALTDTLSHELIEAATDPRDMTDPAYAIPDGDHFVWALMPLGEVGDMCTYEPQSSAQLVGSSWVQRTWSNASAKAGHDPCVPTLSSPYFNSVPVFPSIVTIDFGAGGGQAQTQGVKIPVGQSKTIEVDLFSDAPTDAWTVQAEDTAGFSGGGSDLTFAWDKQTGNNGDKLNLTITRVKAGQYGGSEFILWSQKGLKFANLWFGFVAN